MERTCRICGARFETTERVRATACNACQYQSHKRRANATCPVCGVLIDPRAAACMKHRKRGAAGPRGPMGPRRTTAETVAYALETAEPYGDGCLLATQWRLLNGYVRVASGDERPDQMLHRLVMEVELGRRLEPKPAETVDHTCHNDTDCPGGSECPHRRCVNPDHLEVVTAEENWRRGGQGAVARRRAMTECSHGHPFDAANTYVTKDGHRHCRACSRERERRTRERRKRQAG